MYSYSLFFLDLKTENFTHQRYQVSNDSSLEFVFEFTDPGGYSYDVSMTANDSTNSILLGRHGSDSLCRDERENKMAATYNVLAFKR